MSDEITKDEELEEDAVEWADKGPIDLFIERNPGKALAIMIIGPLALIGFMIGGAFLAEANPGARWIILTIALGVPIVIGGFVVGKAPVIALAGLAMIFTVATSGLQVPFAMVIIVIFGVFATVGERLRLRLTQQQSAGGVSRLRSWLKSGGPDGY